MHPGATEVKHDGVDQDCNGFDLTIDIQEAVWSQKSRILSVTATSSLGEAANLVVPDYCESMKWNKGKKMWSAKVSLVPANPGKVLVGGVEGTESTPVITVR